MLQFCYYSVFNNLCNQKPLILLLLMVRFKALKCVEYILNFDTMIRVSSWQRVLPFPPFAYNPTLVVNYRRDVMDDAVYH